MAYKVLIISQSHLCRNPRVLKEAIALSENGYTVHILNSIFSKELQLMDLELIKDHPSIQLQSISDLTQKGWCSFTDRLVYKLGGLLVQYFKLESSLALGYGAHRYLKRCRAINADLYSCHQELATYLGTRLIEAGYKVAFDLEDWYSADLLPEARTKRPVNLLKKVESIALNTATFCVTTSQALAKKLADEYHCKQPAVIYNVFPLKEQLLQKEKSYLPPLKLFWFSQTIGPGRGIEEFMGLLKAMIKPLQLHLLGDVDTGYQQHLITMIPAQHTLFFHPQVSETELAKKISEFDIGLALELTNPPSRNYTITNKFFQYLQAGLPVIATETAGQKEIFDKITPGIMIPKNPDTKDIERLQNWLNDPEAISEAREVAKKAALKYCWENESTKLLSLINHAFQS
ncbi:glycosyltransferase family protein [Mucilaginibacter sp.]|uniref:glycosyltransferase family protein n=1 Tax=Mucilaginibacter sp. TaxID=1882438 RepID=UPI003D153534